MLESELRNEQINNNWLQHSIKDAERRNNILAEANKSNLNFFEWEKWELHNIIRVKSDKMEKLNLEIDTLREINTAHLTDVKELKEKNEYLQKELTKQQTEYNLIEFPSMPLKEIETRLKLIDRITVKVIVEYLKLDQYELVKNLAKIMNDWNVANVIAYRDWALSRIQALIDRLQSLPTSDSFADRIAGKMEQKK